jgi:hypothetical protein
MTLAKGTSLTRQKAVPTWLDCTGSGANIVCRSMASATCANEGCVLSHKVEAEMRNHPNVAVRWHAAH